MAMSPRLLRPKAAGNTAPQFTTQGYARVWGVTTKSTGNVAGTAETDTGHYAVKWWDNTTTVYDSGDPFSKAAAGNQRAFEVYPCDAGGVASGQFDGFDISNNALTRVRSEDVTLADAGAGGWAPGTVPTQYGYYYFSAYVSGSPAESAILSGNLLSAAALDEFYTDLDAGGGDIFVSGNPGIDADDPTIATGKGYTVFGSVPPETALLLNFNGTNGSTTFTDSSANGLTVTANGDAEISTAQSKFGGASGYFDGTGDYLEVAGLSLDLDDFTVECWVRLNEIKECAIFNQGDSDSTGCFCLATNPNDGTVYFYADNNVRLSSTATLSIGTWSHVALVRQGEEYKLFIDGILEDSYTGTHNHSGLPFKIAHGYGGIAHLNGYIDELRIVKGQAIYTANFTPPAAQLGVYP